MQTQTKADTRDRLQTLAALHLVKAGGEASYTDDQLITVVDYVARAYSTAPRITGDRELGTWWRSLAVPQQQRFLYALRTCAQNLQAERAAFVATVPAGCPLPAAQPAPVPVEVAEDPAPVLRVHLLPPAAAVRIVRIEHGRYGASAEYKPGKRVSAVGDTVTEAIERLRENIAAKQQYPGWDISQARRAWLTQQGA